MSNSLKTPADENSRLVVAVAERRDRESFARLFENFAPRVKNYLLRIGVPSNVAEELSQETLLTVWRKADTFDPDRATASTWIFTIARNLRVDMIRRDGRQSEKGFYFVDEFIVDSPANEYLAGERDLKLREALKTLPSEQAEVMRLSFFEEIPHPEIASQLGIPLGTVKSRVRLAMSRLRAALEELK